MINVEKVSFAYPNAEKDVLFDFSASFKHGEIVAVTGKNGCGKTTLTKLLAGMLRPSSGLVTIDGVNALNMDLFEIGQRVGYVFQNPDRQLFCDTVYNEVAFGLRNMGHSETQTKEKATHFLSHFGLSSYRETYPGNLSHGEKQRLALAAVLALGTGYLVLDEPTTGLDKRRQRELGETLLETKQELNCGIVFVSHEADFIAAFADRQVVMPL